MATGKIFLSIDDENHWIVHINKIFTELEDDTEKLPVCVFHVPKSLSSSKPEDYVPQLIALGPYHHFRSELYPMERFKLTAAKRILKQFRNIEIEQLISELESLSSSLRACYHKYLDFADKTLACIMAIDGLFFIDLLNGYAQIKQQKGEQDQDESVSSPSSLFSTSSGMNEFGNNGTGGVKLTKDAILRDVIMLENQIPTFLVKKILNVIFPETGVIDQVVNYFFLSFCTELSPFPLAKECFSSQALLNPAHLLDLIYHLILPQQEQQILPQQEQQLCYSDDQSFFVEKVKDDDPPKEPESAPATGRTHVVQFILRVLGAILNGILWILERLSKLNLGFLQPVTRPINSVLGFTNNVKSHLNNTTSLSPTSDLNEAPVIVMIPSVTQLRHVGVHFKPAEGGIPSIKFEKKRGTFYLPEMKLDVNSEVIMRNLVAYEAMIKSESLLFTRYTELMRAMIDTVEDVEVLVKAKIIKSSLGEEEVGKVFNGMSKSIGPTKTPNLDKTIEDVNKFYNGNKHVRTVRLMKKYVYSSWKLCTLLATLLLLALMGLQAFCSVYDCPRMFKTGEVISA
ncbi:Plant protein of unknown function (DUF247) [Quillaja saponaria]|uniref:Uncharacterized protein n=1 Tax=Quillaja saponaria TaxID=32244 RepID=A0AAD7PW72_QUISA|nr:Plant protein of unknown function (DUF247) [Quillaja saponaria]